MNGTPDDGGARACLRDPFGGTDSMVDGEAACYSRLSALSDIFVFSN